MNFRTTRACFATAAIGALAVGTPAIAHVTRRRGHEQQRLDVRRLQELHRVARRGAHPRLEQWHLSEPQLHDAAGVSGSEVKALQTTLNKC
ncbi:hypothetical protein ACIQ8D_30940 [Streptomyces sp. NPDC096094]|uniref:hypothetical protein n=1 Tax=Streptomyces sp. NPDC096094 TaxID=3366073 RepID=UPI00380F1802